MAYNTGNAIGSTDARDLYDNAQNLDKAMNSTDPTWTDRFGVARPTFKGAESELNQKVSDAEAAATQALGYLNTMRATSYGPLAEDPTTDPLGNPCTAGDEYFNTTYNMLKRFDGSIWRVPDINTENLASGAGSSMVGHGGQTVEAALNERLPEIGTYALLRAYTGPVTAFFVRGVANIFDGGAGVFRVDAADTTTEDNGGTVLVDADGRRWKREYSGAVMLGWFGGDKTGADDAQGQTQSALDAAPLGGSVVCDGLYKINSTVTISKPLRLIGFTFGYGSQRTGFINETDTALKMFAVRAHYVSFEKMLIVGAGKSGTSIGIEVGDGTTNYDKFSLSDDAAVFGFAVGVEIKTQNAAIRSGATVSTCGVGVSLVGLPTTTDRRNIYFSEANFHSCDVGLDAVNPFYAVGITGCDFNSCGAAIRGPLSASTITGNNFIYSSGTDIDITVGAGLAGNSVLSNAISGNQGSGTGGGIKITGDGSTLIGNVVRNKGGHGIAVFGGLNTVEGNISIDSDYFNSGSYDNIHIAGNVNIVGQNVARNTTGGASRARYGINIASGFGNVVTLNRVDGNVSGQVNNAGSSTIINKNSGYVTENRGSATIYVGSTTVVVNHGLSIAPPSGSIALTMTSNTNVTKLWISNVTSTQFTINANVDPGIATQGIWWSVT